MPKKRKDWTDRWRRISLPKELVDDVEKLVEKRDSGYTSISEFVSDAIRRRLEDFRKQLLK